MVIRPKPINPITRLSGLAALLFVALLVVGPLMALWLRADTSSTLTSTDWTAVKFTLFQATLSASISVILAIPVARALARRLPGWMTPMRLMPSSVAAWRRPPVDSRTRG